jgi:simple sugar transport system permease protein
LSLAVLAGAVAGAAWAFLPGFWKLWWGANEIVTTLMLNFVGVLFTAYMITYPFRDASRDSGTNVQTPLVLESAILPSIWPPYRLSWGLPLAVLLAVALWFFLQRTVLGYEIRMTGMSARAAENAGIPSRRRMMTAMMMSGGLAGIAGGIQVLGVFYVGIAPFTVGLGFTGVAISLFVKNRPLLIIPAALLFAALQNGAIRMEVSTQISRWVVASVIAIVILLVTARTGPLRTHFKREGPKSLDQDVEVPGPEALDGQPEGISNV